MTESEAIKSLKSNRPTSRYIIVNYLKMNEALKMAINALENQIPKKPRFYAHNYYCSVCDNLVGNNEFEWQRFKYCDMCGQKIDWSEYKVWQRKEEVL